MREGLLGGVLDKLGTIALCSSAEWNTSSHALAEAAQSFARTARDLELMLLSMRKLQPATEEEQLQLVGAGRGQFTSVRLLLSCLQPLLTAIYTPGLLLQEVHQLQAEIARKVGVSSLRTAASGGLLFTARPGLGEAWSDTKGCSSRHTHFRLRP